MTNAGTAAPATARPGMRARTVAFAAAAAAALGLAMVTAALCGAAQAGPATATPLRVPDTLAQRALACTGCHGPNGRSTPLGYVPRIAGKPAGYLQQQLLSFRDGRRHHEGMARLLENLDDAFLQTLAGHFAQLDEPYAAAPATRADPRASALGRQLVNHGDAERAIPACTACHGAAMTGVQPAVPGLLGLPRDYLIAQLGAWRTGQRQATAPDCMAQVARRLRPDEIAAVAEWLATQPLPVSPKPLAALPTVPPNRWPLDCGSVVPR